MKIDGKCHCGNISFTFDWPGEGDSIPVRVCSCSFCQKHGGTYTSHPDATLNARITDATQVSPYAFGTETATFHICSRCGVVPFVTSEIDGQLHAVVNVNCFEDIPAGTLVRVTADFEGETTDSRLARRKRNWIGRVEIAAS